jgi:predicted phosphodiesterase
MSCAVISTSSLSEHQAVSAYLTNVQELLILDCIYSEGEFTVEEQTWTVIIIERMPGIERAISYFNPDVIIHIGIARGIKAVIPGDVVVSKTIYKYKSSKIDEDSMVIVKPPVNLRTYGLEQTIATEAENNNWLDRLSPIPVPRPSIVIAPIIIGEEVLASTKNKFFDFFFSNCEEDIVAITTEDMESVEVLCISGIPEIIIRGISRLLDMIVIDRDCDKESISEKIAVCHASAFAFELLAKMPKTDQTINIKNPAREKAESRKELFDPENKKSNQSHSLNIPAQQVTQVQYAEEIIPEPIRILHLSDLHIKADSDPQSLLQPLIADIRYSEGVLGFEKLDYLVISGDLTNRATPAEFEQARQFILGLIEQFYISTERCIIIPGNHDLSWDEDIYVWKPKRSVDVSSLLNDRYIEQGKGFLVRIEELYPKRFENFSRFYCKLLNKEYSLNPEDQCISSLFVDTRIQFLAMNSCYNIDEHCQNRSGIYPDALSRGLLAAEQEIKQAQLERLEILRIAVWHHPVTGDEKMKQDAFLGLLQQANYKLCLHGHIHEVQTEIIGYHHPRKIHVAGTGSFGAPSPARPESTPRLYNFLEIERDLSKIKVHTRCLRKNGGAWEGCAIWPVKNSSDLRTYYEIQLNEI